MCLQQYNFYNNYFLYKMHWVRLFSINTIFVFIISDKYKIIVKNIFYHKRVQNKQNNQKYLYCS